MNDEMPDTEQSMHNLYERVTWGPIYNIVDNMPNQYGHADDVFRVAIKYIIDMHKIAVGAEGAI